jgi:aminomethyltransferase
MGVVQLDAYVLILRGKDSLALIDGLSTNRIEGTCTTVFTTSVAKIIDMVDVIDKGDFIALVGHGPYKNTLIEHITKRILGQDVNIGDASSSNLVYLSTEDIEVPENVTKFNSFRGWIIVAPSSTNIEVTMTGEDYDEYRVENLIPLQGKEITQNIHPLACGLGDLVHESKGCYIGQEILARMRSRGRQGKQLVRLSNPVVDATTIGKTHSLAIRRIK